MDSWGTRTDRSRRLTVAAVLVVLISVPFLLGTAAPAALRGIVPVGPMPSLDGLPPLAANPDAGEPGSTAPAPLRLPTETIAGVSATGPGSIPEQSARLTDLPPARGERALPAPQLRPSDSGWVARRLEIPALGVNVAVAMARSAADEDFPPYAGAYILRSSAQPGRGTNSYLFAHAMPDLFKPLWWAQVGQQVIVTMSDDQQLGYRVTAIVRDIPCPDPSKPKPAGLPPVLANATTCDLSWTMPTATERLTMQTSQGFNRNYGEMVVIAEPDW